MCTVTTPEHLTFGEEAFEDEFKPLPSPGGEAGSHIWEYDEVQRETLQQVWTIVEGQDGGLYAEPGFRVVDRFGYLVTEVPWPHTNITAVWFGANDADQ